MLKVFKAGKDGGDFVVIIEGNSPDEVGSAEARKMAENVAPKDGPIPGVNSVSGPYVLDADRLAAGRPLEECSPQSQEDFQRLSKGNRVYHQAYILAHTLH